MSKRTVQNWALGVSIALLAVTAPRMPAGAVDPEISDVATLSPNGPHRFFTSGFKDASFNIFDADSGKMEGSIPAGYVPNLAIAPDNSQFYVSETYWHHGARGQRDDLLSIYDAKTLSLLKEIALPGRALAEKTQNMDISADGSKAYVYIMHPASSVVWVDLKKQAVGGTVEIPGCALVFPWGNSGFSSLCGDGSLATVTIPESGPAKVTHTKPFFDANKDPVYEASFVDRATGRALFLSYTGLVYPAKLFVLMHMGNYWTHKQGGTEIWVLDTKTKKLISRFPLQPVPTSGLGNDRPPLYASMGVSQDEKPLLYLLNGEGNDVVINALTGEIIRKVEFAGGDAVTVPGF